MFYVRCSGGCGIELKAAWYRDDEAPTKDIVSLWNSRPTAHRAVPREPDPQALRDILKELICEILDHSGGPLWKGLDHYVARLTEAALAGRPVPPHQNVAGAQMQCPQFVPPDANCCQACGRHASLHAPPQPLTSEQSKFAPRRCRMDRMVPAELAITQAMGAVEAMAADVRLTDAGVLLGQARNRVADFVDGVPAATVSIWTFTEHVAGGGKAVMALTAQQAERVKACLAEPAGPSGGRTTNS
jgi:hypothetical protein